MKKILLFFASAAIITSIGFVGRMTTFGTRAAAADAAPPAGSTYTFINDTPTGCPASSPSCNVPLVGGGSMYFSTAVNSAGQFYGNLWFYRPEYNGAISGLAPILTQIVSGTPGCNDTNQYSLTIPATSTTDIAGRNIDVSMTEILTQYYAAVGSGRGGGGVGCHWEALNGTTTITLGDSMVPSAGLTVMKTVNDATPLPGSTVHYTLTASALGPATSTAVTVNDLLPAGLTFVSATSSVGSYDAASGVWTIGDLAASSSVSLDLAAMVDASDTAGMTITNTAMANESDANPDAVNASSSVSVTTLSNSPPPSIIPQSMSIDANGDIHDRGMVVTSVGSSSFEATIWGIDYTVNVSTSTEQSMNILGKLVPGDVVNVSGAVDQSAPLVVNAAVVRNGSIESLRNNEDD